VPDAPAGAATLATSAPVITGPRSHVIAAGDTFWDLAQTYLGDGQKWRLIAEANTAEQPRRLIIGNTLVIPNP
jgi:5'-nucleotidase